MAESTTETLQSRNGEDMSGHCGRSGISKARQSQSMSSSSANSRWAYRRLNSVTPSTDISVVVVPGMLYSRRVHSVLDDTAMKQHGSDRTADAILAEHASDVAGTVSVDMSPSESKALGDRFKKRLCELEAIGYPSVDLFKRAASLRSEPVLEEGEGAVKAGIPREDSKHN